MTPAASDPGAEGILPCPWCAKESETFGATDGPFCFGETPLYDDRVMWTVYCGCGARGPNRRPEADAIAAWNRVARMGQYHELCREVVEMYAMRGEGAKVCVGNRYEDPKGEQGWLARFAALERDSDTTSGI